MHGGRRCEAASLLARYFVTVRPIFHDFTTRKNLRSNVQPFAVASESHRPQRESGPAGSTWAAATGMQFCAHELLMI